MKNVENRLTAIAATLERRQLEQIAPVDGLSASLFALRDEFAALSGEGKRALLKEMNCPDDGESDSLRLSAGDLDKFIETIVKG